MSDTTAKPEAWTPYPPYCWQPKPVLRSIRETLDGEHTVSSGLLVYLALTEIASDKQARTFATTHAYIAMRCGINARTVQRRVKDLVAIGVIAYEVPGLKAPAKYTLLAVDMQPLPPDTTPSPNDTTPSPNDTTPSPSVVTQQKNASSPSLEEYTEESPVESSLNIKRLNASPLSPVPKIDGKQQREKRRAALKQEKVMMAKLINVLGEDEMNDHGGHWRENWVRIYPEDVEAEIEYLWEIINEPDGEEIDNLIVGTPVSPVLGCAASGRFSARAGIN